MSKISVHSKRRARGGLSFGIIHVIVRVGSKTFRLLALISFSSFAFVFILKLMGHAARLPAAPSCGAFQYFVQMQIKKNRRGDKGKRALQYIQQASTQICHLRANCPCANHRKAQENAQHLRERREGYKLARKEGHRALPRYCGVNFLIAVGRLL